MSVYTLLADGRRQAYDSSLIMAVLNVTPDSFSDGGSHDSVELALNKALLMIEQGAQLIDIGGESTRPGSLPVPEEEELLRVVPIIRALRQVSDVLISVDTTKAKVAEEALKAGADIINDISAFKREPEMLQVAARYQAPCMIMHMRGTPETMQNFLDYDDLIDDINHYFSDVISEAAAAGLAKEKLILDPGVGFSKDLQQNLQLIQKLDEFRVHNCPILLGTSRKSFIGKVLEKDDPQDRLWGTAATLSVALTKGVEILRVHDISEMGDVIRMTEAILKS